MCGVEDVPPTIAAVARARESACACVLVYVCTSHLSPLAPLGRLVRICTAVILTRAAPHADAHVRMYVSWAAPVCEYTSCMTYVHAHAPNATRLFTAAFELASGSVSFGRCA